MKDTRLDVFNTLKDQLMRIDPVMFCEKYLTLEGEPFRLSGNGYKPFADIYRYIGLKALEPESKPVIMVKGRQVGGTTMACALEMYFMGSGLFGTSEKPPIRIIHAFPLLELAAAYSKTKLNQMMSTSLIKEEDANAKKGGKIKSYMQSLLDTTSPTNDSLHFKQFIGGNHLWIESTGIDADRLMGRMLALDTDIPTPNGFVKLIDLKVGSELFDENGEVCKITKVHPIDLNPVSYRVFFDDGTTVDACKDHLWLTYTRNDRVSLSKFERGKIQNPPNPSIKTTEEILNTLHHLGETNHSIPNCKPLQYDEKKLIIDPYLLGLWLGDGDGSGRIESADPEILEGFDSRVIPSSINHCGKFGVSKSNSYRVKGLTSDLRKLGLLKNSHKKFNELYNKHIPDLYMQSSIKQRLALLQGLLDSDGHCDKNGNVEFVQVDKNLAYQVFDLVRSLGIKAKIYKRESWRYGIKYKDKYRVRFITNLPVFRLKRKLKNLKQILTTKSTHRFIVDIKPINSVPMRCITVDSHNGLFIVTKSYIPTHNTADIIFFDEVQRTTGLAMGNALKILTNAKYGRPTKGVQVYFGTPRSKGSDFYKMWMTSSQQYYYLGCEGCDKLFPLYTPGSDDWKDIWIYDKIVRCPHCGKEQDKLAAADRGKWVALKDHNDPECKMIGFHINQLYMPKFTRLDIDNEMPGKHPINTDRIYNTEVLGEFYQGDSSPITPDEIAEACGDIGRKFKSRISPKDEHMVLLGIDYGKRGDLEQLANPEKAVVRGQSYSTAVVLAAKGPGLLSIEFATKFKRNDFESKKGIIDQILRQYSVDLAVGDIGYSQDFSETLHKSYGDRYIVSRAHPKVNKFVKYNAEAFPKEIVFERDYYIRELYEQMKKGQIRFPFGDYEKIAWLVEHCASMEIKPSISKTGADPVAHYVKGSTPNDGFMALLNAYLAYKFLITQGFTNNNPLLQEGSFDDVNKPRVMTGFIQRRF